MKKKKGKKGRATKRKEGREGRKEDGAKISMEYM
jgi:hypothetical protein